MKKIKLLLCTIALFTFLNTANAQQLEQEIISFVDDTEVLINNGRRMMLHYVQARNFERVAEIFEFLNERTQAHNCEAFTYQEDLLITLLTNNWNEFFTRAEYFLEIARIPLCMPIQDNLLLVALYAELESNFSQILENARMADLTLEEMQLLELFLHLFEHGSGETYRRKLRAFRRQHPESAYNDFVRHYLPRGEVRGGMGFSMGATQFFPTGNLSNYFSTPTVFNVSWDFSFSRILLGLQVDIGSTRLNTPLLSSITGHDYDFQKGDRFEFGSFMFPIGYTLIRNNQFEVTPFVGLGGTVIRSNIHAGQGRSREFEVVNSFTVSPGLRTEFWLTRFFWAGDANGLSFRFDVGYNMPVRFNYTPARGNVFYARAGIVWWIGNIAATP